MGALHWATKNSIKGKSAIRKCKNNVQCRWIKICVNEDSKKPLKDLPVFFLFYKSLYSQLPLGAVASYWKPGFLDSLGSILKIRNMDSTSKNLLSLHTDLLVFFSLFSLHRPKFSAQYIFKNCWIFPIHTFISLVILCFSLNGPAGQKAKTKQQQIKNT